MPSLKSVLEMKSKIVMKSKCEDRTITVYESGYITCTDIDGNATVFTQKAKLSLENGTTTIIKLSELNGELEAEDILDSIGSFRLQHNKDMRNSRREVPVYDETRDITLASYDSYTIETDEFEKEIVRLHKSKFVKVLDELTDAQKEVVELLMQGYKINQIVEELHISRTSVNDRIIGIKKKFQKHLKNDMYMGNGGWCRIK